MRFGKRFVSMSIGVFCLVAAAPARSVSAQEEDPCEVAAKAGQVLLTVQADADCKLTVNDKPQGSLSANQEKTVKVAGGKPVVKCASVKFPGAVAQDEQLIESGCGSVTFEVDALWSRFTAQKNGVEDTETGLTWAQSDNGKDIDWNGAKQYCTEKGGRLPTQEELRTLHLGDALNTPCGEFPCKMSQHFKLTGRFFWSSSTFEKQAIVVGLAGARPAVQSADPAMAKDVRVLCVSAAK
jgi:Protein of unknown function (DUF1566)